MLKDRMRQDRIKAIIDKWKILADPDHICCVIVDNLKADSVLTVEFFRTRSPVRLRLRPVDRARCSSDT
jgi:hypothetical protein